MRGDMYGITFCGTENFWTGTGRQDGKVMMRNTGAVAILKETAMEMRILATHCDSAALVDRSQSHAEDIDPEGCPVCAYRQQAQKLSAHSPCHRSYNP